MIARGLLIIAVVLLVGCQSGASGLLPTAAPPAANQALPTGTDSSPRLGPGNIPPTWTPVPTPLPPAQPPPPTLTPTDAPDESYVVQPGDTLAEIAIQFGVALDVLAEVNNIANIDHIEVGQTLIIPR